MLAFQVKMLQLCWKKVINVIAHTKTPSFQSSGLSQMEEFAHSSQIDDFWAHSSSLAFRQIDLNSQSLSAQGDSGYLVDSLQLFAGMTVHGMAEKDG